MADTSIGGFGLGASKVYRVDAGVSIGGYGEVLYQNYSDERQDGQPAGRTDQADALRAIIEVRASARSSIMRGHSPSGTKTRTHR